MIDAEKIRQLLDDLAPFIQRFPDLPLNNVTYNRNFVELLLNLYQQDLPFADHLKELRPTQTLRTVIHYQEQGDGAFDQRRLQRLRTLLQNSYRPLQQALGGHFRSIESDLVRLKKQPSFASLAKKQIRLAPLLYSAGGKALPTICFDTAGFPGPDQLQQYYHDTFKIHLTPIFKQISQRQGFGEIANFVGNVLNQFIPKEVFPATQRYNAGSQPVRQRELFIEEVPPLYTPLRGALALDCSMVTVPYFAVLKNTRVFWIGRSARMQERPCGYVFIAEVIRNRQTIPYVITINGSNISSMDCQAICCLLQNLYQTHEVLIADVREAAFLVNSQDIANTMTALSGDKLPVEMPPGWQQVSTWSKNTVAYDNYYLAKRLSHPRLLKQSALKLHSLNIKPQQTQNFYPKGHIEETTLINRTIIAWFFVQSSQCHGSEEYLLELLKLDKVHLEYAQTVINLFQGTTLDTESFAILKNHFDFSIDHCLALPLDIRVASIPQLYHEYAEDPSIPQQHWLNVCQKTFAELNTDVEDRFCRDNRVTQMASIPEAFIPEYRDTVFPLLMLDKEQVDYFLLRKVVPHFRSKNSAIWFLEFLHQHADAPYAVKPEDPVWFEYLKRIHREAPEHKSFQPLLQTLFHDQLLDTDMSISLPEVEKRLEAAQKLGWRVKNNLLEEVRKKRGWL